MSGAKRISFVAVVNMTVGLLAMNCPAQSPLAQQTPADPQAASAAADQTRNEPTGARELCRCIGETDSPSVAKIREALQSPLHSNGLDFVDQPLEEVVNFLQDDYGIPVQLDLPALKEMGLGPEEPVTVNLHNISLRSALRLMLKKLSLTYIVQNEVLMITSPEEADLELVTCVYDATRLVDDTSQKSFDALIDTIVSCVETQAWAENGGGQAEIRLLKPGLLVISQTEGVHDRIRGLLTELDEMRGERPAPDGAASSQTYNAEPLVTRSYLLQLKGTEKSGNLGSDLRDLIVRSLPDERWAGRLDDGQAVVLTVLPDRIVVRHKESVHDALHEFLTDSGVASLARPGASGGEGGGGGGLFQIARPSKTDRN